ncbi:MAG: hypothetical protein GY847_00920 [Proteobacteria bacterium]|nr:hypothetical protein [Pseudomonadota bacterium]
MSAWQIVEEVAVFPRLDRRGRQLIRVAIVKFGSKYFADIRLCYRDPETNEIKPLRAGLTLNYIAAFKLIKALHKTLELMNEKYHGPFGNNPWIRGVVEDLGLL